VTFANGYAGANRSDPNADVLSHRRHRKSAGGQGDQPNLLHVVLLPMEWRVNVMGYAPFPGVAHKKASDLQTCSGAQTEKRGRVE
jgi:hypothetical protein